MKKEHFNQLMIGWFEKITRVCVNPKKQLDQKTDTKKTREGPNLRPI